MASKPVLVLAVLALSAIAGCSDAPPKGDLPAGSAALTVDGTIDVAYVDEVRPAGAIPVVGGGLCPPPEAGALPQCVEASSSFTVHFMALPTPGADGYHVFLTGAGGRDLGALAMDAANMWELNVTLDENVADQVTGVELRTGELVLATASAAAGKNTFAVADALKSVSASGTYKGKVLNVTVSGLPAEGSYMGRLYTLDEESGLLSPGDYFPVTVGQAIEYKAPLNVADHAEFHIHVGTSSINVYKATFPA